ncbi:MAG: hypothetical protein K5851_08720 [Lachnospiraceae bacterium]|nr:hypothetical protein [Lachnospiraceae bacterium]
MEYQGYFERALFELQSHLRPQAVYKDKKDLNWTLIEKNRLFNFEEKNVFYSAQMFTIARQISIRYLLNLLVELLKDYKKNYELIDASSCKFGSPIYLAFRDKESECIYFIKEQEESNLWKIREPDDIEKIIKDNKGKECKYIYLLHDYARLQFILSEEEREEDLNVYSLKDFVCSYFGDKEWEELDLYLEKYVQAVKDIIGFSATKFLNHRGILSYSNILQRDIVRFSMKRIKNREVFDKDKNLITIDENELIFIEKAFIDDSRFLLLFSGKDYSESFITAEWLRETMNKANAIDLTVIGTGYFKAVEQLLYEIICLHKDDGDKRIKKIGEKSYIDLNDDNINNESIDFSIGSMANFYKKYADALFRDILSDGVKNYIIQRIFAYKDLRNGYFQKHNIRKWEIIEQIREESISLLILLVSTINLSDSDIQKLAPRFNLNDRERLCEYVNAHKGNLFFIENDDIEDIYFGWNDMMISFDENGYPNYSGVYFKECRQGGRIIGFKESLPKKISLGKFGFVKEGNSIKMLPEKVCTIFENGKYVGPKHADDLITEY